MLIAPMRCMFIALMARAFGTILTFPIAVAMGLTYKEAAAIAVVGGADGPMVLYASLILARDLFVPITIVAYLYLSLTYAGYPYLVRLLVPEAASRDQDGPENGTQRRARYEIHFRHRHLYPVCVCCFRWRRPCSCRFSSAW